MLYKNNLESPSNKYTNIELIQMIHKGDEEAKEVFLYKNQGMIYTCIRPFIRSNNYEDLYQIACLGMMKALNNFDLSLNLQFSTYAIPIILGELKRYFRDEGSIRISRRIKENYLKLIKIKEIYQQEQGVEPTYMQLSEHSDIAIEDVLIAFDAFNSVISLDEMIYEGDNQRTLYDVVDKNEPDLNILKLALDHELELCTDKEKCLIYMRFHLGYKQHEIADRLHLSQVQVSRMEKSILLKLKQHFME